LEVLEVEIDSLAFGGRGVARADGLVVFVAGGLPGDRVRAEVTKSKRKFAEARVVELLNPSPDRVPDRCVHGGEPCPGAPWQGLPYERQLTHKQAQVGDALRRLGGLEGFELEPIEPAPETWRYRNKLEYSFGTDEGGEAILGFHERGRWDLIVDVEDCMLASERGNAARNEVREWARFESIAPYDKRAKEGVLRNLVVREGRRTTSTPRSRAPRAAPTGRQACSGRNGCARSSAD
jgi:23S rRNA (uracil1939-C5)-methyltransferase